MDEKVTFAEIRAIHAKIAQSLDRLEAMQDRYEAQQAKDAAESKAAFKAQREVQEKSAFEAEKSFKALREELGGMGGSNGEYAENYFNHAIEENKVFAGQHFDEMATNLKAKHGKMEDEFDVVLYNSHAVALIEIKYKARTADLEKMVERKVPHFRALFPYYKDYKIYLGLGSMSFDSYVTEKAQELGIGLLRQDGKTVEAQPGHVKAY